MHTSRRSFGRVPDLRLIALGFVAGVALVYSLPVLLSPWWCVAAIPLIAVIPKGFRFFPLAVIAGALCLTLHGQWLLRGRLDPALDYKDVTVQGTIASLPQRDARRIRFLFRTSSAARHGMARQIRVSWYGREKPVAVNQCWRLTLRIKTPRGLSNPGGFDYEGWLFRSGIGAKAYVRGATPCRQASVHPLLSLRAQLDQRIRRAIPNDSMLGVVLALTLGERGNISKAQWQVLRRTGTSHLVAISGLHVGLVSAGMFLVLRWLWALCPFLVRKLAAQRAGAVAAVITAAVYVALSGFGLPAQRAFVMVAVAMTAFCLGRRSVPGRLWALALLIVLLVNPLALGSVGFWLSFGAVAWILYVMTGRLARTRGWRAWLLIQVVLSVALVPMTILFFARISLVSAPANLLLVPIFTLLVPALLLGVVLLAIWPSAGDLILKGGVTVLHWLWPAWSALAHLPHAYLTTTPPPLLLTVAAVAGLALVFAPRGMPARWAGLALCVPVLLWRPPVPDPGTFKLTVLDVGEGLSAVVRTHSHTLVFDTGPGYPGGFSAGRSVVVPYLRSLGVERLSTLVISHGDRDHRGGVPAVLRAYAVNTRRGWHGQPCRAGQHWQWDGVVFRFLHPDSDDWGDNNGSCVLRVQAGQHAILLTGDIEAAAEAHIVATRKPLLPADVLVAPHHGSNTSSTPGFIRAVSPRFVVFPAGWDNQWGFPRPAVIRRYRKAGSRMWTTGRDGALLFTIRPDRAPRQPLVWRTEHPHFWNYR